MVLLEIELSDRLMERLKNNILSRLGANGNVKISSNVKDSLDEVLSKIKKVARPKGIYRILPVLKIGKDSVQVETGEIQSVMFTQQAIKCSGDGFIVFMIATLGCESEKIVCSVGKIFSQWMISEIGSELIELVADEIEENWRKHVNNLGFKFSLRFSPGYCDWPLEEQLIIFNTIDAALIDVRLTSHFVMVPGKTISAISIVARQVPFTMPCGFCDKENCMWRKPAKKDGKPAASLCAYVNEKHR